MTRKIFVIMVLFVSLPAHSQENNNIRFFFNLANLGIGTNLPSNDDYSLEGIITLINFGIEDKRTNIGIEFTPYQTFGWIDNTVNFSILNLTFYWNALNFMAKNVLPDDDSFCMGLFSSINYFFIGNNFYWKRYIFTTGIHAGLRLRGNYFGYNIISVQTGFRIIDGKSKYYAGVKIDILPLLLILLSRSESD